MHVHTAHRATPEAAAWAGAAILVAGLSLTSSLPRASTPVAEPPALAAAAGTLRGAIGAIVEGPAHPGSAFLRPDCIVLRVPDPRELAAVARGAGSAYPGAHVMVRWAGEHPRAMRVVAVCQP